MSKEICISSTPHETRLAILEDDQLAEIYYERENEYTLAGSIYKGRVTRVLPGMQSAFVEVGLERDAFLYVTDFLEEQGDSADFERVPAGGNGGRREGSPQQAERSGERQPIRTTDSGLETEPVESQGEAGQVGRESGREPGGREQGSREGGSQRSRGRGRNRGRGESRPQNLRAEPQPVDPQPASIQPFAIEVSPQGAHGIDHEPDFEPANASSSAAVDAVPAADDESPEGTRRWRGRRGRRGGARSRDGREVEGATRPAPVAPVQAAEQSSQYTPAPRESQREPQPERVASIRAVQTSSPAANTPIVLPGESLSKYGQSGRSARVAEESSFSASAATGTAPAASAPASGPAFRPSTLVEVPLAWDGSGQLPGETISRYRKPEDVSRPARQASTFLGHESTGDTARERPEADMHAGAAGDDSRSHGTSNVSPEEHSTSDQASAGHDVESHDHAHSAFEAAGTGHEAIETETGIEAGIEAENASENASVTDFSSQSIFESAYQARESSAPGQHSPEQSSEASAAGQEAAPPAHESVTGLILEEEAAEFDPQEASASYRIDPAPPSEFRVAMPSAEEEQHEAPVGFQSVAPADSTSGEVAAERPPHYEAILGSATSVTPYPTQIVPLSEAAEEPIRETTEEPTREAAQEPVREAVSSRGNQPETEQRTKPEGFWQAVKELVIGHSRDEVSEPPTPESQRDQGSARAGRAEEVSATEASSASTQTQHAPPPESADGWKEPEPVSEQLSEEGHHLTEPSAVLPALGIPVDELRDEEGSQSFAPGSGLIEEETIDEEEYDYEPIHASSDDHDLEDLEEETLEHQGGAELGEMVREAHLEQRVKSEGEGASGQATPEGYDDAYGEDASGGFTEEDFEGPAAGDDEEDDEEEEAVAGQVAAPARTDGGRSGESRPGEGRNGDRGRGRGRGRRPGPGGHSGGGRRQNTQASDLPAISELLKQGQEILVQIAKEPMAKKGARITSHIALPGRFLVFMPTVNHVGVSRKISSDEERQRLKRILISEKGTAAGGFIVRTAADGAGEEDLRADIRFLLSLWNEIKQRSDEAKAPALIYHDLNLIERVLRDQVSDNFSAIWVDSETEYERIVRFLQRFQPSLVRRVKLYSKETPLFEQFGIQEEISKALKSKVWLKSGGSIVINQTEALVAIDINTGKFVGKTARLEDTILRTNLDAIPEIVRQIRLRDLGGIIVIDFIDMDERKNRNRVMQALEDELKHDRAPSKVLQFNDFGLVAITRKRVKQSLERTLSVQCEVCTGTGMVKSPTTVCNEIYIEMRKMHRTLDRKDVMLRVHPEVVKSLKSTNGRWLNELEEMTGKTIIVKSDPALHPEQFDIH